MKKRKSVLWFANQMESVLQENDDYLGWDDCYLYELMSKLLHEVAELQEVVGRGELDRVRCEQAIKEAVDVANYAMMIADNIKYATPPNYRDPITGLVKSVKL